MERLDLDPKEFLLMIRNFFRSRLFYPAERALKIAREQLEKRQTEYKMEEMFQMDGGVYVSHEHGPPYWAFRATKVGFENLGFIQLRVYEKQDLMVKLRSGGVYTLSSQV